MITFGDKFPSFIVDLVEFITGYSISNHFRAKREVAAVEEKQRILFEKFKEEKLKNPEIKEKPFRDRLVQMAKTND